MSGEDIRKFLVKLDVQQKDIAEKMGYSQQNFSSALKVKSVKTDFIENLCRVLGISIAQLYGEENPIVHMQDENITVQRTYIDDLRKDIADLKKDKERLLDIIENLAKKDIAHTSSVQYTAAK
jgi:DNA-binding Xre family transcriptional regulator